MCDSPMTYGPSSQTNCPSLHNQQGRKSQEEGVWEDGGHVGIRFGKAWGEGGQLGYPVGTMCAVDLKAPANV